MDNPKINKIEEHLANIDVTLAKQSVILEEHIKRTYQLEERVTPIERHIIQSHGILKFIGFMAGLLGAVEVIFRVFKI